LIIDEVGPGQLLVSEDLDIQCGQIRTRVLEGPKPHTLPAMTRPIIIGNKILGYLDARDATPLIREMLEVSIDDVIVGKIRNGTLMGEVCGRRVSIRVVGEAPNGSVIAVIPVTRISRNPPKIAIRLLAVPLLAARDR